MSNVRLTPEQVAALAALANGVIPADETDAGAASVDAAGQLARRIESGANTAVYLNGLAYAERAARERFGAAVRALDPHQVHELVGVLRAEATGFFKQLRMDVSGLYLSDPAVWARIGFPGPSTETGGHPDFDRPQGPGRSPPPPPG